MKDRSRKLAVINTGRKPQTETGVATTTVVHSGVSGGGSSSMNLSDYLLKQIWDKAFEIRVTETGEEYLFGKLNFATQYGITMYANGGLLDLPSIYDGLPLDNDTIYWEEIKDEEGNVIARILKSRGVGEGGVTPTLLGDLTNVGSWANAIATEDRIMVQKKDSSSWEALELSKIGGSASFENVKSDGGGNAFTSFVLSDDKKTLTFVKGDTFAKQSDFSTLNTKVTDFLEGSDTDGIINKWKELEAFLSGMKESDDLATILATKWTKDDAKIANWDAAFGWGDHSKAGYMKKSVIYDDSLKCWKLDGDLLVTGGITMFANEGQYTPSTITDAVNIDGDTLIRVNGVIMLNPDIEIGGGTDIDLSEYAKKATTLSGYGITDAYTKNAVDGLLEDKADTATTLAGYGITNAYTKTQVDNLIGDFVTSDDVETLLDDYLPLTGGTITGDLRLRKGSEYTSPYLYFGDSDEVWMKEATDKHLTIHADGSVKIDSPKTVIDGIEIKKSASGVLFIDANLVVSGGITMYGTDGTSSPSIWYGAPKATTTNNENGKGIASFDSKYFSVTNGHVTFIGSTGGGGIDSITKQMVIDALGFTPYDEDNPDGFITGITKSMVTTALGYTPYNSTNPSGYITGITKSMVTTALGFTPYNATNPNGYITSSGSITGNAATATTATNAKKVLLTGSASNGNYRLVFSDVSAGTSENNSLYVDSANEGARYNPSTNQLTCLTYMSGASGYYIYNADYRVYANNNEFILNTPAYFSLRMSGSTKLYMTSSGLFGIGTTSPESKLHVAGSVQADNTFWLTSNDNGSGVYGFFQGGKLLLRKDGSGNTILSADSGGIYLRPNGSIYATAQSVIDTSGNLLVAGGVTMYSDLRKKTILNHVELSLKEVADAPLIEHYYNSDEKKTTHVGSVAQYWAELNDWFCKEDEEGFLTMEIQNAALASAISVARELQRYESKTDKKIRLLKKRIGELEEEIENLKKM